MIVWSLPLYILLWCITCIGLCMLKHLCITGPCSFDPLEGMGLKCNPRIPRFWHRGQKMISIGIARRFSSDWIAHIFFWPLAPQFASNTFNTSRSDFYYFLSLLPPSKTDEQVIWSVPWLQPAHTLHVHSPMCRPNTAFLASATHATYHQPY